MLKKIKLKNKRINAYSFYVIQQTGKSHYLYIYVILYIMNVLDVFGIREFSSLPSIGSKDTGNDSYY